jgi:DNA-binding NarL/FixJ family response regulator
MQIIILDDHSLFSEGLGNILTPNFKQLNLLKFTRIVDLKSQQIDFSLCDLLISDIELPGEDVFAFLEQIKTDFPNLPILVVSMHNKLSVIKKCKELGVEGYILKDDHELIIDVVNGLLQGCSYYSAKVEQTLNILNKKELILTPKEEQIIALIAAGRSSQEIADELFISYNTIKTHRKNIYRKLDLNTNGELIKYYFENYI